MVVVVVVVMIVPVLNVQELHNNTSGWVMKIVR